VFDLSITKILVLAVIALIVFGPNELPKVASQAGRVLRDLRRIAEGAKADLREGLGPEFQDFDFEDLNPKTFVRKHLFDEDEQQALFDQFRATTDMGGATGTAAIAGAQNGNGASNGVADVNGGAVNGSGSRAATIRDGEQPPFDFEAT
jgi:sec-independent protein translocase protein TatB